MSREWFTAQELAGLPDVPGTERGVNGWGEQGKIERRKRTKGKGWEYRFNSLPAETQAALLAIHEVAAPAAPRPEADAFDYDAESLWAWAQSRPQSMQDEGARRAKLLDQVVVLVNRGQPFMDAARLVAQQHEGLTPGSLRNWYYGANGQPGARLYARSDWSAALMPRWAGRTTTNYCTPEAWDAFKADYLRLEHPSANACYRRLERLAQKHDWTVPTVKALLRRLRREVGEVAICLAREGLERMLQRYPAQERDRSVFYALEAVNADGHKFDLFVNFPGDDPKKPSRPMLTAWQDLYSGQIVGWRISRTESSDSYRLSFLDLLRGHGIPKHIYLDNGRGIASKMLTGGSLTRNRGKITAADPVGLMTQLVGSEGIHWATPYHGQAKPIERAFRDMCENIATDPRFHGAWTGNNTMSKPENYMSKTIDLETFLAVLEEGINEHNARQGRRTAVCAGRSFKDAFDESYAHNAHRIARPTERQLRQWMLAAQSITVDKREGSIRLMGNRYWCEALARLADLPVARRKVTVYFDPDNLHTGVWVHSLDGREIGFADCQSRTGFNDTQAARDHARSKTQYKKATKAQLEAQRRMDVARLGDLLNEARDTDGKTPTPPEQKVVHGAFQPARRVAGSDVVEQQDEDQAEAAPEERYRFDETVALLADMKRKERL